MHPEVWTEDDWEDLPGADPAPPGTALPAPDAWWREHPAYVDLVACFKESTRSPEHLAFVALTGLRQRGWGVTAKGGEPTSLPAAVCRKFRPYTAASTSVCMSCGYGKAAHEHAPATPETPTHPSGQTCPLCYGG